MSLTAGFGKKESATQQQLNKPQQAYHPASLYMPILAIWHVMQVPDSSIYHSFGKPQSSL
jgi:hypothetical protein